MQPIRHNHLQKHAFLIMILQVNPAHALPVGRFFLSYHCSAQLFYLSIFNAKEHVMTDGQSSCELVEDLESSTNDKAHHWKICSLGKHYVRTHSLHVPPSKEHPVGEVVLKHGHCADNQLLTS